MVSHTIRKEVAQRESHDIIYGSINHVWLGYRDSQCWRDLFPDAGQKRKGGIIWEQL